MVAGGGHLERPARGGLAADIAEISCFVGGVCIDSGCGGAGGRVILRLGEHRDDLGEMADAEDVYAIDDGGLGGIFGGEDQVANFLVAGADGDRKSSANGSNGTVERELSHDEMVVETFEGTHCAQNGEGHGEIETGTFFAELSGGEIDGDGLVGVPEAGVHERGLDALTAFANRVIGGADQHEIAGHTAAEKIDLDVDGMGVDSVHGGTSGLEERHEP